MAVWGVTATVRLRPCCLTVTVEPATYRPDLVRRSVVAHEVAHLVHFDHSPAFHALLGELYEGDIRAANRWLKQHGRTLYTRFG